MYLEDWKLYCGYDCPSVCKGIILDSIMVAEELSCNYSFAFMVNKDEQIMEFRDEVIFRDS
jgi:hypothetical protein